MKLLRRMGCLTALILVLCAPLAPAGAGADGSAPRRVVMITLPRLGWDDITGTQMPVLAKFATEGAVASLSVRTFGRFTDRAEAYATLGAGTRATASTNYGSSGFGFRERVFGVPGSADALPVGPDGTTVPKTAVVVPGIEAIRSANDSKHEGAVPGLLGATLKQAQKSTQVVANHDSARGVDRLAALATMDQGGITTGGRVFDDLTVGPKTELPSTNTARLMAAVRKLPVQNSVSLVELGDIDWADYSGDAAARVAAITRVDALLGKVLDTVDLSQDLVLVFSPVAPRHQEQPTPFLMVGPGVLPGTASSPTTHRTGYVTLPDVAPTVLARLGIGVPDDMSGTAINVRAGNPASDRVAAAQRATLETRFVDRAAGRLLVTLPIVFACWSLVTLLVFLFPADESPAGLARPVVRWAALVQLAVPVLTYLSGIITLNGLGQPLWHFGVWTLAALIAGLLSLRPGLARAPLILVSVTWLVLVIDLLTGGHLAFDTPLGNSPTVGGRFTGLGNVGFGLLAGCTLILAVAVHGLLASGEFRQRTALAAAAGVFGVAILVDGFPGLGSDLGGMLTLVPTAAVTLALLWPRRVEIRQAIAVGAAATLLIVTGAVTVDLLRPADQRTHLGRTADRVFQGGGIVDVVFRKGGEAIDSIVRSSLVWIPICTLLLIAGLLWLARPIVEVRHTDRTSRALWWGTITACVLGGLLNDSGVMIPAMILLMVVPTCVYVTLGTPVTVRRADQPEPQPESEEPNELSTAAGEPPPAS